MEFKLPSFYNEYHFIIFSCPDEEYTKTIPIRFETLSGKKISKNIYLLPPLEFVILQAEKIKDKIDENGFSWHFRFSRDGSKLLVLSDSLNLDEFNLKKLTDDSFITKYTDGMYFKLFELSKKHTGQLGLFRVEEEF